MAVSSVCFCQFFCSYIFLFLLFCPVLGHSILSITPSLTNWLVAQGGEEARSLFGSSADELLAGSIVLECLFQDPL